MYQTFSTIMGYLKDSGKIATDADKKICWIVFRTLPKDISIVLI